MLREALAVYSQNFRLFLLTSCLLSLPVSAIAEVQSAIAPRGGRWAAFSTMAELALVLAGALAWTATVAALTVLAADLQTGGSWGWRDAWRRGLVRTRPVFTGYMAFALAAMGLLLLGSIFRFVVWKGDSGRPSVSMMLWICVLLSPLASLLAPVATLERRGGFRSLRRSWQLLQTSLRWKAGALLVLVNLPALVITAGFNALLPQHAIIGRWLGTATLTLSEPVIALVALSVYRRAGAEQDGYTDAQLRGALDAI
jgi:hypothetical protein